MIILNKLKDFVNRVVTGKLTKDDKNALLITFLIAIIAVALIVFISYYFIPILALSLIGYLFWDEIKPASKAPMLPSVPTAVIVYKAINRLEHQTFEAIGVRKPLDIYDVAVNPSIISKNNVEMVQASISKNHMSPLPQDELQLVKLKLQKRVNDLLQQGEIEHVSFASPDGQVPIIFIDAIHDNGHSLLLDVIYVDTPQKLNYIYTKKQHDLASKRKQNQHNDHDTDF